MSKSRDLFDDSTMSFGEHLEVLRVHLWKAILGLILTVIVTLYFGDRLVAVIRAPIDAALKRHSIAAEDDVEDVSLWETFDSWLGAEATDQKENNATIQQDEAPTEAEEANMRQVMVQVKASDIARVLHTLDPDRYPLPNPSEDEQPVALPISAEEFREFRQTSLDMHRPVTLNVQEAFMMYLKVAFVAGLIFASPWVIYQMWLFVAAGLYPHERKYVYVYLPVSTGLFLGGAAFCFFAAMPVMLDFLLGFNRVLGLTPQIRMSEWVSFVISLPLMFGISFQLPVVMLFLERISIFNVATYRANRRLAILAISVLAMVLTPTGDPGSMMLMFLPLVALYELGILMCARSAARRVFES